MIQKFELPERHSSLRKVNRFEKKKTPGQDSLTCLAEV